MDKFKVGDKVVATKHSLAKSWDETYYYSKGAVGTVIQYKPKDTPNALYVKFESGNFRRHGNGTLFGRLRSFIKTGGTWVREDAWFGPEMHFKKKE